MLRPRKPASFVSLHRKNHRLRELPIHTPSPESRSVLVVDTARMGNLLGRILERGSHRPRAHPLGGGGAEVPARRADRRNRRGHGCRAGRPQVRGARGYEPKVCADSRRDHLGTPDARLRRCGQQSRSQLFSRQTLRPRGPARPDRRAHLQGQGSGRPVRGGTRSPVRV